METKYKPNLGAQMREHEIPEHKGKWKNFYMLNDGRSGLGKCLFNSAKEAANAAKVEYESGEIARKSEYTVIQIPVAS